MYLIRSYFSFIILCLGLFVISCSEEEYTEDNDLHESIELDSQNALHLLASARSSDSDSDDSDGDDDEYEGGSDCFEFVFPVEVSFPDGTRETVDSEDELDSIIDMWLDNNPESVDAPQLVFPLTISTDSLGNVSIATEEELCDIISLCYEEESEEDDDDYDNYTDDYEDLYDSDCYEFVYPVELSLPDGSVVTIDTEDDLEDAIEEWFLSNPDNGDLPSLVYPVNVITDSAELVIQTQDELYDLENSCIDEDDYDIEIDDLKADCFSFIYPVSFMFPDGSTQTASSEEEASILLESWYDANPDTEEEPVIIFPIDVQIDSSQVILSIPNIEELVMLIDSCYSDDDDYDDDDDDDGDYDDDDDGE